MNCPECGQTMIKDGWITGHLGNIIGLEILFWVLFLIVFLTEVYGLAVIAVVFTGIVVSNWGKTRYSCPQCSCSVSVDD